MDFLHHLPTFEEGICCNGKERQLKHKLAKQEGLKPRWRVLYQRVFELLSIPLEQASQLEQDEDHDEHSHLQEGLSSSNPWKSHYTAPRQRTAHQLAL